LVLACGEMPADFFVCHEHPQRPITKAISIRTARYSVTRALYVTLDFTSVNSYVRVVPADQDTVLLIYHKKAKPSLPGPFLHCWRHAACQNILADDLGSLPIGGAFFKLSKLFQDLRVGLQKFIH
jgi:hypothetical protein